MQGCALPAFIPCFALRSYHRPFRIGVTPPVVLTSTARSARCLLLQMREQQQKQRPRQHPILADLDNEDEEDYDNLTSNDEYIVVDGKDVNRLVGDMIKAGRDGVEVTEEYLSSAESLNQEKRMGQSESDVEKVDRKRVVEKEEGEGKENFNRGVHGEGEMENTMEYFTDRNIEFMPRWVAEAYKKGEHEQLYGPAELFAKVERKALGKLIEGGAKEIDYSLQDIAVDYNVPVEFVVDMMVEFGVALPIYETEGVRERLSESKLMEMRRILTTYDSYDLSDRYSDRTLEELCEMYEIDEDAMLAVCQKESVYLSRGLQTRLQLTREDGVLDVAMGRIRTGVPYPSVLDGL